MKYSFFRDATECLLDHERSRAFYKAIARVVRPGDIVLDCGTGTGILAIMAVKEGARQVIAIEQDRSLAEIAVNNAKSSGQGDKIQVAHGDAAAFKGHADVIVMEMLDTGLITEEQARVINAFVSKGVITSKTKVIPLMCSNFFELVHYDFEFYDFHMPMIIQARNSGADERCLDVLSNATLYSQVMFNNRIDQKVNYKGQVMVTNKGYLNALKFSTVTNLTEDIMLGATPDMNMHLYVPVHEMVVKAGDIVNVQISYYMSAGYESLNVNVS